ncbi:Bax inhibitor-1/YccA family protein [Candidatus Dojkabacteria bacterium]|uniref:Bax inhibitor-1/YccA family protein n=1 Tax=Candidatus Dojkabacteria bacterium TaxID=2099670 RepID=A0A955KZP8_9BACT|nr:Bax inhibitor-1/YccA family protein [Candidatus Dojkabacteria bacterium]
MNSELTNRPINLADKGLSAMGTFLPQVYGWMTLGLFVTAVVAGLIGSNTQLLYWLVLNQSALMLMFIVELVVVVALSGFVHKMNIFVAAGLFLFYATLNGIVLGVLFMLYTEASIFSTFLVTGGTFAVMAVYGMFTNADLSRFRNLLFMGLVGLVFALIVNVFLRSEPFSWVLTFLGLGIFMILTAYDTQKIKRMAENGGYTPTLAIRGALTLYLDFINIFIRLLQIFGRRK